MDSFIREGETHSQWFQTSSLSNFNHQVADPIRLATSLRDKGTVNDMQRLSKAVLVVERMIAQNSFDDILQGKKTNKYSHTHACTFVCLCVYVCERKRENMCDHSIFSHLHVSMNC